MISASQVAGPRDDAPQQNEFARTAFFFFWLSLSMLPNSARPSIRRVWPCRPKRNEFVFFFPNKNHRCASFLEWQRAQTEIVWFLGRIHKILESSPNEMDLYPRMYGFQQHIIPIWTNTNGYVWFTSLPKKKFLTFHSLANRNNFHIEFVNIRLNLIFRNSSLKKQDQHKNEHLLYLEQLQIFYSMTRLSLFLHFIENSIVDKDPLLYLERWKTNTDRF